MAGKTVVITGASTGIGRASVEACAAAGWHVFAGVRRTADGDTLTQQVGDRCTPILLDVTKPGEVAACVALVRDRLEGRALAGLVNNAGIAVPGPLEHLPIEQFQKQIDVNVTGVLRVTQALLPLLRGDTPGRIVNISSVSGKIAFPLIGAYVASKHALEGLSESMRRELRIHGIAVSIVGPGTIETPIWDKADDHDFSPYADTVYADSIAVLQKEVRNSRRGALPAARVGELVRHILTTRRPKRRYAPVPGKLVNWTIPRLLPARLLDAVIASKLKLARR